MKRILKTLLVILLISLTGKVFAQNNTYSIIYEADKDGKMISGSLEKLLESVQSGNPIRVGWELNFNNPQTKELVKMQHWTDAGFITTLNGHVFAQINSIYQQGPSPFEPPSIFLVSDKPHGWVAIIGTTGVLRQKYKRDEEMIKMMKQSGLTDDQVNKQLKDMETMKVTTKWAVMKN